jgi:solute carrier family 25, member 44
MSLFIVLFKNRSLGYGNENGSEKKPSQLELIGVQATAGTLAGACSSVITTPIDTIKTRLQVCLFFYLLISLG